MDEERRCEVMVLERHEAQSEPRHHLEADIHHEHLVDKDGNLAKKGTEGVRPGISFPEVQVRTEWTAP